MSSLVSKMTITNTKNLPIILLLFLILFAYPTNGEKCPCEEDELEYNYLKSSDLHEKESDNEKTNNDYIEVQKKRYWEFEDDIRENEVYRQFAGPQTNRRLFHSYRTAPRRQKNEYRTKVDTRIVGGKDALENEFPWQVAFELQRQGGGYERKQCGGTLIFKQWVLTAAHCFYFDDGEKGEVKNIILGEHNKKSTADNYFYKKLKVIQNITHDKFNPKRDKDYDIALIKFAPVSNLYDFGKRPACLPFDMKNKIKNDESVTVTGWGYTSNEKKNSNVLKKVSLKYMDNKRCSEDYKMRATENMFCAYSSGKDSCQGDSGGPVIWKHNNHHYIVGIVSWGIDCDGKRPGVYVKLDNFKDWVLKNTNPGDELCYP